MRLERIGDEIKVLMPSKVNLFLEVVGRRPDGYHELVTVIQAVSLYEELRIRASEDESLRFWCDHPGVPCDGSNLVLRAADALRSRTGLRLGAEIELVKRGPVGGGMGSGSADAAAALVGLNEAWGLKLGREELHEMGAGLGSDVNFFLECGTAICRGRGEKVEVIAGCWRLEYVLVFPGMGVSTREAFSVLGSFLTLQMKDVNIVLKAYEQRDFDALCQSLFNRLEIPVFHLHPSLAVIKDKLMEVAPGRVLLSGSGSTFFCLCENGVDAAHTEEAVRQLNVGDVCRVHTA